MTVFARFTEEFPDREETRIILLLNKATGEEQLRLYLDERFCADPECDCQRMMLYAIDEDRVTRAAIGYDFTGLPGRTPDGVNPFLEPGVHQPPGAVKILEYVRLELERDASYRDRLRRHYHELKECMRDPQHPLWPAVLEDRRVMKRVADRMARELAGAPPTGPDWARRERNRRKRNRKRK
jgi:hypothetical protein